MKNYINELLWKIFEKIFNVDYKLMNRIKAKNYNTLSWFLFTIIFLDEERTIKHKNKIIGCIRYFYAKYFKITDKFYFCINNNGKLMMIEK